MMSNYGSRLVISSRIITIDYWYLLGERATLKFRNVLAKYLVQNVVDR